MTQARIDAPHQPGPVSKAARSQRCAEQPVATASARPSADAGIACRPALLDFLGLNRHPFLLTPDPRAPYCSRSFHDCYRKLRGPLATEHAASLLIGEPGMGKTLLLQCLRNDYRHGALPWPLRWCVCGPGLGVAELLRLAEAEPFSRGAESFGCQTHALLLVDEADHLGQRELDRLLRITGDGLRVVLAGSPRLALKVRQLRASTWMPAIRSLHLRPLQSAEVVSYIAWRLDAVGCNRPLFSTAAVELIARCSGGVPRQINRLASSAILAAFMEQSRTVASEHLEQATEDDNLLVGEHLPPMPPALADAPALPSTRAPAPERSLAHNRPLVKVVAGSLAAALSLALGLVLLQDQTTPLPISAPQAPAPAAAQDRGSSSEASFAALEAKVSQPTSEVAEPPDPALPGVTQTASSPGHQSTSGEGGGAALANPSKEAANAAASMLPQTSAQPETGPPSNAASGSEPHHSGPSAIAPTTHPVVQVYIHYSAGRSQDQQLAEHMASDLRGQGFTVAELRPVDFGIHRGSIRYFFAHDRAASRQLMAALARFAAAGSAPAAIKDFTHYRPSPRPGTLEIWVPNTRFKEG